MRSDVGQLTELAAAAARAGARAIQAVVEHGGLVVEDKSASHDLVTNADRASEQAVLAELRRHRPQDAVLAEESGVHPGASDVRWLVDPLDGTANFVHGRRDYAVSVAAERRGTVVAGAVYRPADDEWAAGGDTQSRGSGASFTCSTTSDLGRALIGVGFPYDLAGRSTAFTRIGSLVPMIRDFRRTGSAACDLLAVASGGLDAFVGFGLAQWDVAAGRAVVPAAGGQCEDLVTSEGTPVFIAGTSDVVAQLVAILGTENV